MIAKIIAMTNKEAKGIDENGQECRLKALNASKSTGIFVGDNVVLGENKYGVWTISKVLPRRNLLNRPKIANLDQVFITVSIEPAIDYYILDIILINCQMNNIDAVLIINKADLIDDTFIHNIVEQYSECVSDIIITNALTGENVESIKKHLSSKTSAFIGQSAVGKSTIINNLDLGLNLKTNEMTLKAGKKRERGRNTTRASTLFPLENGGFIADSPGFSRLDLSLILPQELVFYFPDIAKYRTCKYSNCTHLSEGNDCGVITAFTNGLINRYRYERFTKLQASLIDKWRKRYD